MSLRSQHEAALRALPATERERYMTMHSGLPGPRGDLELLDVIGDIATDEQLHHWAASADEYFASVREPDLAMVRSLAEDPRWRVREGVAMALWRDRRLRRQATDAHLGLVPIPVRSAGRSVRLG
jgi:hypothetical protein